MMSSTPESLLDFVWMLSNVFLPLSVGLVIGIVVRPVMRCFVGFMAIVLLSLCILSLTGIVEGVRVGEMKTVLTLIGQILDAARNVALRFPAATLGLMLGILLREFWHHRIHIASK